MYDSRLFITVSFYDLSLTELRFLNNLTEMRTATKIQPQK